MGHRLSKIYTRTGDKGTTGLGDGSRVPKDHARVEAYGAVDELNSFIGLLLCESLPDTTCDLLTDIQHDLFDVGSELVIPGRTLLDDKRITALENELDTMNAHLQPLKEFILRGGTRAASLAHVACTVCRRAERRLTALSHLETNTSAVALRYLNRLSDLLFVMARYLNLTAGRPDVLWQPGKTQKQS